MMNNFRLPSLIVLLVLLVSSVSAQDATDESESTPKTGTLVTNIDASGDWAYYSLSENKAVPSSEKTSTNWDVAFMGTSIMVNGGVQVVISPFDKVVEAPEDGYETDDSAEGTQVPSGSGAGWFWYDPSTHSVYPNPETIHVIQTRDGKYAKFEVVSYYKDQNMDTGAPRFFSFRYSIQEDGSRSFQ